jgi:hypothetical protein
LDRRQLDLILETSEESGWKRVFSAEATKDISYDFSVWHVLNVTMLSTEPKAAIPPAGFLVNWTLFRGMSHKHIST